MKTVLPGYLRRPWLPVAVVAVGVHGLLLWLYHLPGPKALLGDELTYLGAAKALMGGIPNGALELLWPPLYIHLLAGLLTLGGGSLMVVQAAQSLLLAASAVVLFDLGRRLTGSTAAASIAGALVFCYPPMAAFAHYLWPEIPHLFLLLAAVWILLARNDHPGWLATAGLSLGLALGFKLLLAGFVPVLVAAGLWGRPLGRAVVHAMVIVLAMAIVLAPIVWSNHRHAGQAVLADSLAFNLWVGLEDTSRRNFCHPVVGEMYQRYSASGADLGERNRATWERVRELLGSADLLSMAAGQLGRQYFRLFDKDSFLTMQLEGGPTPNHAQRYSGHHPAAERSLRLASTGLYGLILILAPLGFALWRFRHRRWVEVLLAFVAYNLLLFFWLHVKTRYRIQFLPVFFLGAGCGTVWLWTWWRGLRSVRPTGMQWLGAGVTAAVLLFLAFAGPLL